MNGEKVAVVETFLLILATGWFLIFGDQKKTPLEICGKVTPQLVRYLVARCGVAGFFLCTPADQVCRWYPFAL